MKACKQLGENSRAWTSGQVPLFYGCLHLKSEIWGFGDGYSLKSATSRALRFQASNLNPEIPERTGRPQIWDFNVWKLSVMTSLSTIITHRGGQDARTQLVLSKTQQFHWLRRFVLSDLSDSANPFSQWDRWVLKQPIARDLYQSLT